MGSGLNFKYFSGKPEKYLKLSPDPDMAGNVMRFGLCCKFFEEPIKFRTTTATSILKISRDEALLKLSEICLHNADALMKSLLFCNENGIGSFRVNSKILPLKTHPDAGYELSDLPGWEKIKNLFRAAGKFARENDIRTTFHPDQFVILNSPKDDVIEKSIQELLYQSEVAGWIGADVINIHGGGVYGDKSSAIKALMKTLDSLPENIKTRLTLENDDRSYTPEDLIPVCTEMKIPFVYDIHHHRCLQDGLSEREATEKAIATWNREPLFHLSSPKFGWGKNPKPHSDFINPEDVPIFWLDLDVTVEVEAKAKEVAIKKLMDDLSKIQKLSPERLHTTATKSTQ